ncbi:MAG: glycosyltransferase, partial [Hyphomicrobiaceae bacterium]|nr:glycosyltransferase [Hyphomicrobiaceae bacterium]
MKRQLERHGHAAMSHHMRSPLASAMAGAWLWQKLAIVVVLGLGIGMAVVDLPLAYFALTCIAAGPFALIVAQRLVMFGIAARSALPRHRRSLRAKVRDQTLPVYSVLVPLFREAEVLPGLVRALYRLDYPPEKLDILIILEAVDAETLAVAKSLGLPGHFRIVIVPDGAPRTKPKALNFALRFARGAFVTVFDAEDVPEPTQLLDAVDAFRRARGRRLGCVQARLNIYNHRSSWLAAQFTLEYSALFDGMLPALQRLRLPIPLGGTSNHFPRSILDELGGWDPFNVTEDADLGIRLARAGYEIEMLASTTWEEAPATIRDWLPQRTRWLKGWMQTYLVH